MNALLRGEDISIRLGQFHLDHVSIDVQEGDYCCILGQTGAGKSVLLESFIGMYPQMSGKVFLRNREITGLPPEKRNLGIVYQDYMLFPNMNVFNNIAFGLKKRKMTKTEIRKRVHTMAERLAIGHLMERDVRTLSGGEKQRTAISRALITEPDVLLMDEAFSALDATTRERMRGFVRDLVKELGTTVVHVTHDVDDVWALANRVVVMFDGQVLQYGAPMDVFSRPLPGKVASFVGACNVFSAQAGPSSDEGPIPLHVENAREPLFSTDEVHSGESVIVSVRPESITLAPHRLEISARNQVPGRIVSTERRGPLVWIHGQTDAGPMKAVLTESGLESMGLSPGDTAYFIFKAGSLRILSRQGGKA